MKLSNELKEQLKPGVAMSSADLTDEQYDELVDMLQSVAKERGITCVDFSSPRRVSEGDYLMWDEEGDIDAGPTTGRVHLILNREPYLKALAGEVEVGTVH